MSCYVYILASKKNGTLYTGVTRDLICRVYEHKNRLGRGFTSQYDVKILVFFEQYDEVLRAIQREKNIKHWSRRWKINCIEQTNPDWNDLYSDIMR